MNWEIPHLPMTIERLGESPLIPSATDVLQTHLQERNHRMISIGHTAEDLRVLLQDCRRYYLDLDGSLVDAGTTTFKSSALDALRGHLSALNQVTFLTGKPESEVDRLMQNLPGDLQGGIRVAYEKGAYQYLSPQIPRKRLLATKEMEDLMDGLRGEFEEEWAATILERHNVRLIPAGDGTHRCILSLDLLDPAKRLRSDDPERLSAKVGSPLLVQRVIETIERELLRSDNRAMPLTITNLGNANIEIHPEILHKAAIVENAEKDAEEGGFLVMGDSRNDQSALKVARDSSNGIAAVVFHETTPQELVSLADIAVAGHARGDVILQRALEAQGRTDNLVVVSNTPSLQRINGGPDKSEFVNRMGAPVAIGNVVEHTRNALWVFPSQTGDNFADYPNPRMNRKFRPVHIGANEYESQYNRISNGVWWFWAHPNSFQKVEDYPEEDWRRYRNVSTKAAGELHDSLLTDDPVYVSTHDFQVSPTASEFRRMFNRPNIRFHLFWHIPFPNAEQALNRGLSKERVVRFLKDLEAYDVVGFHTQEYVNHYLQLCAALQSEEVRPTQTCVVPISVDVEDIRKKATHIANAKDFRFHMDELNKVFEMDLPPERRRRVIAAPPERADVIKGGPHRNRMRKTIAQENRKLLEGKRFLEVLLPTRMDNAVYAGNYREMEHEIQETNRIAGEKIVFTVDRIDKRDDVYGMFLLSDNEFTSIDDGFNMTIPEKVIAASATRHLPNARKHQLYATNGTGFLKSLREHGMEGVIPSISSPLDTAELRSMMEKLLRGTLPEPDYETLDHYFAEHTLEKWMQTLVRTHVQQAFSFSVTEART